MTDPDSVLNSLTREVKEVGPDGQEVIFVYEEPHHILPVDDNGHFSCPSFYR